MMFTHAMQQWLHGSPTVPPTTSVQPTSPPQTTQTSISSLLPIPLSHSHTTGGPIPTTSPPHPNLVPITLPPHICPPTRTTPCSLPSVLLSPDLLPQILSPLLHLPHNLLALRLVCRICNDVIHSAPELRLVFFALPMWGRPAEEFVLLNLGRRLGQGLRIRRAEEVERGCWVEVVMSRGVARRILGGRRRYGSVDASFGKKGEDVALRLEDLFVVQPPIVGMQAFVETLPWSTRWARGGEASQASSEAEDDRRSPAVAKLACDAGITLGFLAETTLSLLSTVNRDRAGRAGSPSKVEEDVEEEEDGRRVLFKAIVSFCAPRVASRKRGVVRTVTRFG